MFISYGVMSEGGNRKVNEDSFGICITSNVLSFIVCDGLGGHGQGDVASRTVVKSMQKALENGCSMEDAILFSQDQLMKKQEEKMAQNSMKTTLTCLSLEGEYAKLGHVGDSRIYWFEKGKYKLRTADHSIPQLLVKRGEIKEKDIRNHEDRSSLLRVMGIIWDSPKYQILDYIKVTDKSSFLLCSDGFWELIDEKMMSKTLKKSNTPDEWLTRMQEIILHNGKGKNMDNYTAIAVFIR